MRFSLGCVFAIESDGTAVIRLGASFAGLRVDRVEVIGPDGEPLAVLAAQAGGVV